MPKGHVRRTSSSIKNEALFSRILVINQLKDLPIETGTLTFWCLF